MLSNKLRRIKEEHPSLSQRLDNLVRYIFGQLERGRNEVVPALVAAYLHRSEAEALGLLMLLEQKSLLSSAYDIYCREKGTFLKRVQKKQQIPEILYCGACDEEHADPDDLDPQLIFLVNQREWEPVQQNAFV